MRRCMKLHVLFALLGSAVVGCGHDGRYVWAKTTRYSPQRNTLELMTDRAGRYVVAMRPRGEDAKLVAFDQTTTYVETGKPFGFRRDARGHTIAYTYRGEHDLGVMGAEVKYLCWVRRQYQEPVAPAVTFSSAEDEDDDDCLEDLLRSKDDRRDTPNREIERDLKAVKKFRGGDTNPYGN